MDPVPYALLEPAARELCDYIVSRGGCINAGHDYDQFRRYSASPRYTQIMERTGLKPKALVLTFPSLLRWEATTAIGNGTNLIHAVNASAPVSLASLSVSQRTQDIFSYFGTSDAYLHPRILIERLKLMNNGFLADYKLKDYEFKWAFNLLASHTIRLSGVLATAPSSVNFVSLKESILNLISSIRNENVRYELQGINVFCYLVKDNEVSAEALCYFTLVHPSNVDVLAYVFDYLVNFAIPSGLLHIGATVLAIDPRRQNTPWQPHSTAISYIPDLICARRAEFYLLTPTVEDATEEGESPNQGYPRVSSPNHAAPSPNPNPAPFFPTPMPVPAPEPTLPNDLPALTPAPYGHLENGLASSVVHPERLAELTRQQRQRFEELKVRIADVSSDSARNAWWYRSTEEGTFVLYKHSSFLLGEGSEAKVYLGGYLESDYASADRDVVRQNFSQHARGVAVKQYFTKESKIEINNFRMLPRNANGIINYLASFEMHDDLYTVQELGLVSLSDRVAAEVTFQERLCMLRGACLAVRELHRRSGGPIVHRDIRLPNFLLSEAGRIKICDFGISRILADSKKTIKTKGGTLAYLSFQPHEVQMAITEMLRKREQRAKQIKGADWEEQDGYIPISPSSDIFMLGLVLFRLVMQKDAMTNDDICEERKADLTELSDMFSGGPLLAHLLEFMLSHSASRRPTIDQVLEHPFFRSWSENHMLVQGLYKELHDTDGLRYSENFRLLESMLLPLEQQVNWERFLAGLPPNLAAKIVNSKTTPILKDVDGNRPHTLPHLHGAIQWLRHFFTHFADTRSLVFFHHELRAGVKEGEALGEFVYAHASLSWILPGLWGMRLHFLQQLKKKEDDWDQRWFELQRENEEMRSKFSEQERKMKSLFALSS
eukprot:gene33393-40398_t